MKNFSWASNYEGFLVALAPLLGLLAAYFYELGRYSYFDIPKDLLELSTPKVIAAVIGVASFLLIYTVSWLEDLRSIKTTSKTRLIIWHLIANAVLTAVFWLRPAISANETAVMGISSTVLFTIGTIWLHSVLTKLRSDPPKSVSIFHYVVLSFYIFSMFSFVSLLSGYLEAKGEKYWLSRAGHHQILVGTFNGQYILKEYDPKTLSLKKGQVTLSSPDGDITFYKLAVSQP